jgi:hypothetical protein
VTKFVYVRAPAVCKLVRWRRIVWKPPVSLKYPRAALCVIGRFYPIARVLLRSNISDPSGMIVNGRFYIRLLR